MMTIESNDDEGEQSRQEIALRNSPLACCYAVSPNEFRVRETHRIEHILPSIDVPNTINF